jgi:hypothetical protein
VEFYVSVGLVQSIVKIVSVEALIMKMVNNADVSLSSYFGFFGAVILNYGIFNGIGPRPLPCICN